MSNQITKSIIIQGNVADIYNLWTNFENFPSFMKYIKSVKKTGNNTSHWIVEGPLGSAVEWDAETTRMEPNKRIAWNSTSGNIKTSGQVTFTELPRGETEVTVTFHYVPPAGLAGRVAAGVFRDPDSTLLRDLRNFKAYAEGTKARIVAA